MTFASHALELYGASLTRGPREVPARGRYARRRGAIRDSTREDYRRQVERYWLPALGSRPLGKVAAPDLSRVLAKLASRGSHDLIAARGAPTLRDRAEAIGVPAAALERAERGGQLAAGHAKRIAEFYEIVADEIGYLTDGSLRRIFAPVAALFATAAEEGVITHSPARDVRVPTGRDVLRKFDQETDDGDDPAAGKARAMTREQLDAFLLVVDPRWRLLFTCSRARGCASPKRSRSAGGT